MLPSKLKAIQALLTQSLSKVPKRSLIILATVAIGILFQWLVFMDTNGDDQGDLVLWVSSFFDAHNSFYYTKYSMSFLRSVLFLILCHAAINITSSYRVIGLMFFVLVSMLLDLGSIISFDFYYAVKAIRYTDTVNFRGLYTLFEVFCVLYTFADWTLNRINNRANDNTSHDNGSITSHFSKSDLAGQKKTSQTHR